MTRQFEIRRGRFMPHRTDDLQNNAEKDIGREFLFRADVLFGDDDPYPGEWSWVPVLESGDYDRSVEWAWVSDRDIEWLDE